MTIDCRAWHPMSRYGVSPLPTHGDPVEVLRDSGRVHLAVYVGTLWRDADRPTQILDAFADRIAFWRECR